MLSSVRIIIHVFTTDIYQQMCVYIVHVVCLLFIPQPPRPPVAQDRAQRQERETLYSMEVSYL